MPDITTTAFDDGSTVLKLRTYRVDVTNPEGETTSHSFDRRVVVFGSHPDADLCLDDRQISRQHCQIEVDEGGYRLRDLQSKNGTFINTVKVVDCYLEPGLTWTIGSHHLTFDLENKEVEIHLSGKEYFGGMLGRSKAMREVFGVLARVASTDATVLVEGESGTGKELAAIAIHEHSSRNGGPFIVFDCSAVPRDLVESELFGHVRGAFTGAVSGRKGAFERAHGGTLFIDELGELNIELQPKLLRALESGNIQPVGGTQIVPCDARIIAATNRNLKREIEAGHFREDLYYRVAVIEVGLPPLRKRIKDIPFLVEHFLKELSPTGGKDMLQVSFATMEKLKRHRWPGNIRELKNFIERAAVLADGDRVETKFLKVGRPQHETPAELPTVKDVFAGLNLGDDLPFKDAKGRLVEAFEKTYWSQLLERTGGNVSKAARIAGVHRKSVEYIMKKLDLRRDDVG